MSQGAPDGGFAGTGRSSEKNAALGLKIERERECAIFKGQRDFRFQFLYYIGHALEIGPSDGFDLLKVNVAGQLQPCRYSMKESVVTAEG